MILHKSVTLINQISSAVEVKAAGVVQSFHYKKQRPALSSFALPQMHTHATKTLPLPP